MKTITLISAVAVAVALPVLASDWESSPNNWENSPNNWDNSPRKWENSPNNWENSPNNYSRQNGLYAPDGSSVGYITRSPSGTYNVFSNSGERLGYGR